MQKRRTNVARNTFPILTTEAGGRVIRCMRTWIETGAKILGKPLTELEPTHDHLDNALRSSVMLRHHLKPGGVICLNNRRIVHARTPIGTDQECDAKLLQCGLTKPRHPT